MEATLRMITSTLESIAVFASWAWGARIPAPPLTGTSSKIYRPPVVVVVRPTKPNWRKGEIPKIEIVFENNSDHVVWMPEPIGFGPWVPEEDENAFQAWAIVRRPAGTDMLYGCMNGGAVERFAIYRPLKPGQRILIRRELRCYDFSAAGWYEIRVSYWDRGQRARGMAPAEAASTVRTRLDASPATVVIE